MCRNFCLFSTACLAQLRHKSVISVLDDEIIQIIIKKLNQVQTFFNFINFTIKKLFLYEVKNYSKQQLTYKTFQFLIKILMKKHILKENYNKIYLASQLHGNADVIGNQAASTGGGSISSLFCDWLVKRVISVGHRKIKT